MATEEEEEAAAAGCLGAGELRVGSRISVLLEQVVNEALVVSFQWGQRSFSGILLQSRQKSGLFCVPPPLLPKQDDPSASSAINGIDDDRNLVQPLLEIPYPSSDTFEKSICDPDPPSVPPPGTRSTYPPYFEGAPFPPPIWLRHSYNQWVPQPPPRTIKRTKRRLSRNRDSGRLIMSTIRLRPRQVLCEKCKNTLNPENDNNDSPSLHTVGTLDIQKDQKRDDELEFDDRRGKKEMKEVEHISQELVPRSPVIKISFSTPQGTGEVVEIPSRVHGSVEPFCPRRILQNGGSDQPKQIDSEGIQETSSCVEKCESSELASIPKLKLTRPMHSSTDAPPPKIRLKPHRMADGGGVSVYKAELINELNIFQCRKESDSAPFCTNMPSGKAFPEMSSGSSGEDDDFKGFPHCRNGHTNLNLLMNYHKRNVDSSSISVCSTDSLDDSSKSSSSELTSPVSDFLTCDDVSSSSKDGHKTVPPLTVRLHTKCISMCVTDEGKTFTIGDIVWGKIHGFPWWPASILSIITSQREYGEPPWQEAKVSWFGSPTTSFLSVSKLCSFSEFFKQRFNRKKKGLYRKAITEAANAVEHLSPEIRELLMQCDT
ncbi:PWWP domain-containing protein 2B [Pleurodeles waltl]|uniref:PWWP domain-containing protein 2B n=1 Tax=Pleurodeles waltl TaxID=8319 RepID=UPI0037098390